MVVFEFMPFNNTIGHAEEEGGGGKRAKHPMGHILFMYIGMCHQGLID